MMEFNYHSQFLLDKEKDKPTAKVRFRIKWSEKVVAFNLGYRVDVEKWSAETQRCKTNTTHGDKKVSASIINKSIQKFETVCAEIFDNAQFNNLDLDKDQFKNQFNVGIGRITKTQISNEKTFFEVFDMFTLEESRMNIWTLATIAKFQTVKNHLVKFNPELTFEFFCEEGLFKYQSFLQKNLKFKNSTVLKQFSFLRWFLRWATKKKINVINDYEFFRPKLKTTQKKIIFLNQLELKKLREYKIPKQKIYLERVRDVFLFQCFTGLRYSDVANLRKTDVKENTIEITTVKTSDSLIIELNKFSKDLLIKYKESSLSENKAFPVITNQKMNDYLKELAELAEIDEPIRQTYYKGNQRIDEILPKYSLLGTHAGRRTFICNALSLGISPQVVMKWTGHSDYKAMKPYIDIADETKISAMEKFNML